MKFHQTQYIYLAWAAHSDEIFYFFSNKYIFDTHWRVKSPVMSVLSVVLSVNKPWIWDCGSQMMAKTK